MDRLNLGVVVQSIFAQLTADTRLLVTTEWHLVGESVVAVDPDGTGTQFVRHADSGVDILGVYSGRETVVGVVSDSDGFFLVLEFLDRDDRTENLLTGNLHVLGDVGENSGLDEVTLLAVAVTSGGDGSTLLLASVDVLHNTVELETGDHGALEGVVFERIADLVGRSTLLEALDELVVDTLLDQDTGAGTAALAVVEEDTKVGPGDGIVDISIVEDNVGRLAAEFQSNLLQVALSGSLENHAADVGGASEGNLVNVGVGRDGTADHTAKSGDGVKDTSRVSSFLDELGGVEGRKGSLLSRLHDNRVAGGEGGANLPGPHHDGEVPRNDLTADTNGLVASVDKGFAVGVDGLTVDLVGPTAIVTQAGSGATHVDLGDVESFTVVDGFDGGNDIQIPLKEIGQLEEQTSTLGGSDLAPVRLKAMAGSSNRYVDILLSTLMKGSDGFLVGRVDGLKGLAFDTLDPFVVDEPV